MDPGDAELTAIRNQFCILVARWRLTQSDLRSVLGDSVGPFAEGRVLPNHLTSDAERRMRLLLRLNGALEKRFHDDDIAVRIRQTDTFGNTPLQTLADLADLRLAVVLAEGRLSNEAISWFGCGEDPWE